MKKTLAAVLAAAMALSTASVAFATDTLVDATLDDGSTIGSEVAVEYGEDTKKIISQLGSFDDTQLGRLVDEGKISVSVIVTEGSSKLASKPTISLVNVKATESNGTNYVWSGFSDTFTIGNTTVKAGDKVNAIPVDANGDFCLIVADVVKMVFPGDSSYDALFESAKKNYMTAVAGDDTVITKALVPQLKFKVAHTYGTGETTVKMKLRITVRKNFEEAGVSYDKGDTYTSDEFEFEAAYHELANYSEDMELTLTEVDENNVKLKGENLYSEIGAENFVIYFDDTAAFSAKLSSAQKDVNLYYSVDEIEAVTDAYPDVDFEFISFYGAPSFLNSGSMTFNAIGAKNTTVYSFDGETLTPLDTTFDSTYGTVTAKGIKKLTTFVVADQVLEVEEEEEEPAEEVTETPEVDESNPNTGAC